MKGNVEVKIDQRNRRVIYIRPKHSVLKNTLLNLDGVLCINLARSTDRWENMMVEQRKTDYVIERFPAIDGNDIVEVPAKCKLPKNTYACLLSHIGCLEYAKSKKWKSVLILEDDAILVPDFDDKLHRAMSELPDDWSGLWMNGTQEAPPIEYSKMLQQLVGSWGAFGYIIRDTMYDILIQGLQQKWIPCDDYYRTIHKKHNFFIVKDRLVKHRAGLSVRENRVVDFPHLK